MRCAPETSGHELCETKDGPVRPSSFSAHLTALSLHPVFFGCLRAFWADSFSALGSPELSLGLLLLRECARSYRIFAQASMKSAKIYASLFKVRVSNRRIL